MAILITIIHVFVCLFLIIVVLLQSGKSGDIAAAFGGQGSQTAFGPRGSATVLTKATTWCAVMFMVCSFAMVVRTDKAVEEGGSILQKVSQPAPKPAPVTTPVTPQPSTHNPLPTGQQTQPPASQAPANPQPPAATSKPAQTPPASSSAPASSKPAEQTPTSPPSAPAPTKKP